MSKSANVLKTFLIVQVVVLIAVAVGYFTMPATASHELKKLVTGEPFTPSVEITRKTPLRVTPLYDDSEVVSDEELAAVLKQIRPRFAFEKTKPNYVEHALRTWSVNAVFQDPKVMSGAEMKDFLVDHGRFLASWGEETKPLLENRPEGVAIRWGKEAGGSVHHDHWLASLTEAGVQIDEPVFTPGREKTIRDVIEESLRDFRPDERETEWSAMAFGLWLAGETNHWQTKEDRTVTFNQMARRLMRGDCRFGVCSGTHRVYSLVLLWRLNQDYDILSAEVSNQIYAHLEKVRDLITECQFEDGHWPSNWSEGKTALEFPIEDPTYRKVIATGHHLEWLALAPKELHPPREMILKAADWIIADTTSKTPEEILSHFTFYSHVGNALSLWRNTHAATFWKEWQAEHPWVEESEELPRKPLVAPRP